MTAAKSGLGRGLGELFQKTDFSDDITKPKKVKVPDGAYFEEIAVDKVYPNPKQPRQVFDEDELSELAESIKEVGLLQPIVVRKIPKGYELVMGERRWRAHQQIGIEKIPAIIRETGDDDLLRDALLENLHRTQLNPLEEAAAYQQMIDDFGCSKEELASKIKRSRPQISNTIRLLNLAVSVQRKVAAGVISAGHARALLGLTDKTAQENLAERIVAEGLSVRATEEAVAFNRPQATPRKAVKREQSPRAVEAQKQLADIFDTKVRVDIGKSKGKITIDFADEEDLERILRLLND